MSKLTDRQTANGAVYHRCGNRLALGMAILHIFTIEQSIDRKLCGSCNADLKAWFATYGPKSLSAGQEGGS